MTQVADPPQIIFPFKMTFEDYLELNLVKGCVRNG
jgi:hypothetical protein